MSRGFARVVVLVLAVGVFAPLYARIPAAPVQLSVYGPKLDEVKAADVAAVPSCDRYHLLEPRKVQVQAWDNLGGVAITFQVGRHKDMRECYSQRRPVKVGFGWFVHKGENVRGPMVVGGSLPAELIKFAGYGENGWELVIQDDWITITGRYDRQRGPVWEVRYPDHAAMLMRTRIFWYLSAQNLAVQQGGIWSDPAAIPYGFWRS